MINNAALDFASQLLAHMGFSVSRAEIVSVAKHNFDIVEIDIDHKIPTGGFAEFLHSVQTLVRLQLANDSSFTDEQIHKVVIDINGFVARNIKDLETKVALLANRAVTFGVNVSMEPLNPFERKIAHSLLDSIHGVRNESVGFGRERHIVIYPTKD